MVSIGNERFFASDSFYYLVGNTGVSKTSIENLNDIYCAWFGQNANEAHIKKCNDISYVENFTNAHYCEMSEEFILIPINLLPQPDDWKSDAIHAYFRPLLIPSRFSPGSMMFAMFNKNKMEDDSHVKKYKTHVFRKSFTPEQCLGGKSSLMNDSLLTGKINHWLDKTLASVHDDSTLFFMESISPYIYRYDFTGSMVVDSLKRYGFKAEEQKFFETSELSRFIDGLKTTEQLSDALGVLSAYYYYRSTTAEQLKCDRLSNLLYLSQNKPKDQSGTWKGNITPSDFSEFWDWAIKNRTRTLQVYDLADGGRFLNEIPVPPLFRILEIDANGDLWAVSDVDRTSVTITRYRIVRED